MVSSKHRRPRCSWFWEFRNVAAEHKHVGSGPNSFSSHVLNCSPTNVKQVVKAISKTNFKTDQPPMWFIFFSQKLHLRQTEANCSSGWFIFASQAIHVLNFFYLCSSKELKTSPSQGASNLSFSFFHRPSRVGIIRPFVFSLAFHNLHTHYDTTRQHVTGT